MEINKFRIWNYRSIIDSGDCYPTSTVTILAGKNESGKSSVLQALEDFDLDREIREKAIPIASKSKPKISIWFLVCKDDVESILHKIKFDYDYTIPDNVEICLTKEYPSTYSINAEFISKTKLDVLPRNHTEVIMREYNQIATPSIMEVAQRNNIPIPVVDPDDLETTHTALILYSSQIAPHLPKWSTTDQQLIQAGLKNLIAVIKNAMSDDGSWIDLFTNEFCYWVPNFILFSSFEDVFPNEIPIADLKNNKWIADLQAMSDIDIETIAGDNQRAKKSHKHELNLNINADFSKFWTQDISKLSIDWDNENLYFWIEENGEYYEPEIRSQGRRWHLAFYIRVSARSREGVPNVILIDEPGLYLHANAQRDILANLDAASEKTQVIFSTHSPYLIEPGKLDRVRLVCKRDSDGSVIANKLHACGDKETLAPILTAIGLELNRGIVAAERTNNIVVEGPSDYFYLTALKRLVGNDDLNFISGGSSGNMPKVGTILQGWGCKVIYLYDHDQAYKDAQKHVKKEWVAITKEMLAKIPVEGAIEDMFSREDYALNVLGINSIEITGTNSEYMKGKDKVLKARQFLDKVSSGGSEITLSRETISRVNALFEELRMKFSNYEN